MTSPTPDDKHSLSLLLKSHFPIIVIETHDEPRVISLFRTLTSDSNKQLMLWNTVEGLQVDSFETSAPNSKTPELKIEGIDYPETDYTDQQQPHSQDGINDKTQDPEHMLSKVKRTLKDSILLLLDFHTYLEDAKIIRLLKEIAHDFSINGVQLVLISHAIELPKEIQRLCCHFTLTLPSKEQLKNMVRDEAKIWQLKNKQKVSANPKALELLTNNLVGLTESDAKRFIRGAIYDDGAITHSDVSTIMEAKFNMLSQTGALSYCYDTVSMDTVGGFKKLKQWLAVRKPFFIDETIHHDIPKGMLLLGVQGCGKSLAAKAVAGSWSVPLLKIDFGGLYNKYIGETEKNIREALASAENLAPCILWIDEIEKGLQNKGDETGTSGRILSTLLTWMAENKSRVFIVATANAIASLPPELMRKGRMDEIFFVDLPNSEVRNAIFLMHLKKREHDIHQFDLSTLANASDGFSGAEIEQAIICAQYQAHADQQDLSMTHVLESLKATQPLSVVRAEEVAELRSWAMERTVLVD